MHWLLLENKENHIKLNTSVRLSIPSQSLTTDFPCWNILLCTPVSLQSNVQVLATKMQTSSFKTWPNPWDDFEIRATKSFPVAHTYLTTPRCVEWGRWIFSSSPATYYTSRIQLLRWSCQTNDAVAWCDSPPQPQIKEMSFQWWWVSVCQQHNTNSHR